MKVLLDEDLPHKLRSGITGHDVSTVAYMGWSGLKNGALVRVAEEGGFEVFVTADKNLESQQNIAKRRFGVVVLSSQDWPVLKRHLASIEQAIRAVSPGTVQVVLCGDADDAEG